MFLFTQKYLPLGKKSLSFNSVNKKNFSEWEKTLVQQCPTISDDIRQFPTISDNVQSFLIVYLTQKMRFHLKKLIFYLIGIFLNQMKFLNRDLLKTTIENLDITRSRDRGLLKVRLLSCVWLSNEKHFLTENLLIPCDKTFHFSSDLSNR